jgi:hypothetical protein
MRHVPTVLMVLPWEMHIDAADVKLYGESDCGEEARLELLGRPEPTMAPAGSHASATNLPPDDNHPTGLALMRQ